MRSERSASKSLGMLLMLVALIGPPLLVNPVQAQVGLSQVGSLKRSPADIVKRYVRLDQKGARLDVMGFDVMAPYVNWQEEEVWSRVVVIQSADVPEDHRRWEIRDNLDVVIPVTFHVWGTVDLKTATFMPDERTEEVRFRVKAVGNYWSIVEPKMPPHVGVTRMLNFVRQAGLETTDDTQRRQLASLEQSLRERR